MSAELIYKLRVAVEILELIDLFRPGTKGTHCTYSTSVLRTLECFLFSVQVGIFLLNLSHTIGQV